MCDAVPVDQEKGFGDIPVEIQEHIFDFLPLRDRKSASRVNSSWLAVAFSNRFLARIRLTVPGWTDRNVYRKLLLTKSARPYRNIYAAFGAGPCNLNDMHLLMDILNHFAGSVQCLQSPTMYTTAQLSIILNSLPRLKELEVDLGDTCWQTFDISKIADVKDLELKKPLEMSKMWINLFSCKNPTFFNDLLKSTANHLKDLNLSTINPYVPLESIPFPKLTTLRLSALQFKLESDLLIQIFKQAPKLQSLRIDYDVTRPVFDTITECCCEIRELYIRIKSKEITTLNRLCKLPKLHYLNLSGEFRDGQLQSCPPLPSVRKLFLRIYHLDTVSSFFHQIERTMMNLEDIHVRINNLPILCKEIVQQITRNLHHLSKFTIEGSPIVMRPEIAFRAVNNGVSKDNSSTTKTKIGRLRVSNCSDFRDADLLRLAVTFPELMCLELCQSRWISKAGLAAFAKLMPNCTIKMLDKYENHM